MTTLRSRTTQYVLLVIAVLVTRWFFRSQLLYDLDSVNFATGMERFDVTVYQPHAPGYYLYIVLGRLFSIVLPDANDSLVAISILFSCLGVIAIHRLTETLYDRKAALMAGFVFLFSPLYWFHGTVALVYIIELFFAALIGWLCWQTYSGERDRSIASAATLALCMGFRQSAVLFLGPLLLLSLRGKSLMQVAKAAIVFSVICLAWFVPMAIESGGAIRYLEGLYELWTTVAARETSFDHAGDVNGLWVALARALTILAVLAMTFGFFIVSSVAQLSTRDRSTAPNAGDRSRSLFYFVWLAPGLLFFTFIFLRLVNSGYLLVLTPPLCAWLGSRMSLRYRSGDSVLRRATPFVLASLNLWIFLYAPVYCTRQAVVAFERQMRSSIDYVRRTYDPTTTLLVGLDAHFHGFRHASYYLPEYETIAFPAARKAGTMQLLTTKQRDSRLVEPPFRLPYELVVFFPMPHDDEYEERMNFIVESTPGLEKATTAEHVSAVGSIGVIAQLYPSAFPKNDSATYH